MRGRYERNVAYSETTTKIGDNGEIIETTNTSRFKAEVEPSYIKLYIEDIAYFYKLDISSDLMYALLKYVNYEQEIVVNKTIKERIAKELNKSLSYVNNNITKLVKNEVIIRAGTGLYELNTYLFGKGNWKDILKHRRSLELNVFYNFQEERVIEKKHHGAKKRKERETNSETEKHNEMNNISWNRTTENINDDELIDRLIMGY